MTGASILFFALLLIVIFGLLRYLSYIKLRRVVVFDYQRGVVYNKGMQDGVLGPGLYWATSKRTITAVDMRKQILNIPGQEILTTDGIAVKISATAEYSISDPALMLTSTANFQGLLYAHAQQSLRTAISEIAFDALLGSRQPIGQKVLELLTPRAAVLGVSVTSAQVLNIMLPSDIRRAYAQTVTAQKEGLAALERARGETASLRSLSSAARLMQDHPGLLQLRSLQAIEASKGNSTLELRLEEPSRTKIMSPKADFALRHIHLLCHYAHYTMA